MELLYLMLVLKMTMVVVVEVLIIEAYHIARRKFLLSFTMYQYKPNVHILTNCGGSNLFPF